MKKKFTFYRQTAERSRGQALVVIAVSFVALLLFIGLAIDGGMVLVNYGNLRRSVDAASLAAASQVRESSGTFDIENVAKSTMQLNGVLESTVVVKTCDDTTDTPQSFIDGCNQAVPRKLVYVEGQIQSPLAFMQLIGFTNIPLSAWAVGEAAALDVTLVIDVSDSMAGKTSDGVTVYTPPAPGGTEATGQWSENPIACNAVATAPEIDGGPAGSRPCMPFYYVKSAAVGFAENVLDKNFADSSIEDEDRMSIVTFAVGYDDAYTTWHPIGAGSDMWSSEYLDVAATINSLGVYPGANDCNFASTTPADHIGKCRFDAPPPPAFSYRCGPADSTAHNYDNSDNLPDFSTCGTTSIGSGLLVAAKTIEQSSMDRPNAVRVVILLTDGANNASAPKALDCDDYTVACDFETDIHDLLITDTDDYFGYCPEETSAPSVHYFCRDKDVLTRKVVDLGTWDKCPMVVRGEHDMLVADCPSDYDADDFAMDMAEFVGCPTILPAGSNCRAPGQGAVMFTIGMGAQVTGGQIDDNGRPYGAYMLRFIAEVGEDGEPIDTTSAGCTGDCVVDFGGTSDSCATHYGGGLYDDNCGNYYFAANAQDLGPVFEAIAARIFTRIAQ